MERIYITSSDNYYLLAPNNTKKYTLVDVYNNKHSGNSQHISFNLYVKENGKFIDKKYFQHCINYKNINNYTLDEIISIHKLGIFTLSHYNQRNKLENPINIKGRCYIKLQGNQNNCDDTVYCNLVDYYWFLYERNYTNYVLTRGSSRLMYDDVVFDIKDIDLHINGKYILEYTANDLSTIMDSQNYVIGPNSTLPNEVFQEVITPQEFTLDDYFCNVADGTLFINKNLKDYYPCKNGVLQLVINYHKPTKIILNKNDNNLYKLIEEFLKYNIAITIV